MKALLFRELTKTYKNGVHALKGIDLDVEEGDFFALLGPNGAGKTTAIGIVTSLVNKSSGKVEVFGHDIDTQLAVAKSCIGLVPQEINFQPVRDRHDDSVEPGRLLRNSQGCRTQPTRKISDSAFALGQAQCRVAHAVGRHEAASDDCARADARAAPLDSG
jgi:ABC-type Mn2+/Zn2+ transport system ATPase subunit